MVNVDKIKQNKNYSVLDTVVSRHNHSDWFETGKSLFAWALVIILIVTLFPSLAVSASSESVDFSDQPIPELSRDAASILSSGMLLYSNASYYGRAGSVDNESVFVFGYQAAPNGTVQFYFVTEVLSGSAWVAATDYNSNSTYGGSFSNSRYNEDYDLYFYPVSSISPNPSNYTLNVPVFSTVSDGYAAVRDYIDNGGGSGVDDLHEVSFSLPQGNVAYIDISGNSGDSSEAYFSLYKSMSFWDDRGYTSQSEYIGYANSIPSSIDVSGGQFSGLSQFHWSGVPDYNIFGQAKNYQYLAGLNSSANYLVVYNAVGNQASSGGVALSVRVTQARSVRVIPLTTDYSDGGYSATGTDSDALDYTYDESSGTWSWSSGGSASVGPVEGGNTVIDSGQLSINQWLQKIANDIGDFFSGAIGAVTTLIGYASDFIQSISGLYSWLPGPVYSVLISALIIAITIGVIKVFI